MASTSHAFTLLEATMALALVASVLVAILLIRQRLMQQSRRAHVVAKANVLAGRLVAEWKNGSIYCDAGRERDGKDDATGYLWKLSCAQQEIEPGVFLKCLKVRVYADGMEEEPTVAFEAWQPLR